MSDLTRLSISLPATLLDQLDAMGRERGLTNRSQLVAELIRGELARHGMKARPGTILAGTITLIYQADSGRVRNELAQTQLRYLKEVISSQHVFLEDDQSLEVLLVQGAAETLGGLCDELRAIRGVRQLELVSTVALLPPLHSKSGDAHDA